MDTVELAPINELELMSLEHDIIPTPKIMALLIEAYNRGCEDTY